MIIFICIIEIANDKNLKLILRYKITTSDEQNIVRPNKGTKVT